MFTQEETMWRRLETTQRYNIIHHTLFVSCVQVFIYSQNYALPLCKETRVHDLKCISPQTVSPCTEMVWAVTAPPPSPSPSLVGQSSGG